MASTIKGIKTADNVVHKIDGAAFPYGKACVIDPEVMSLVVPLTLGAVYSDVPAGAPLTFFYENDNVEPLGEEHVLKAHKQEGSDYENTLYFSPDFSDDSFTITTSDLSAAYSNSFYISFTSNIISNYMTIGTHTYDIQSAEDQNPLTFAIITDSYTAMLAKMIHDGYDPYEQFKDAGFVMRNTDEFLTITENHSNEFLPVTGSN